MRIQHLKAPDDPDVQPTIRTLAADPNPWAARQGRMHLELVNHLETRGPAPDAFAYLSGDDLWLTPSNRYNRVWVSIAVVWRDYGPVRDGCPELYYRLGVKRGDSSLCHEERTRDLERVERVSCEPFGWVTRASFDSD